jgi:hypothetical protein
MMMRIAIDCMNEGGGNTVHYEASWQGSEEVGRPYREYLGKLVAERGDRPVELRARVFDDMPTSLVHAALYQLNELLEAVDPNLKALREAANRLPHQLNWKGDERRCRARASRDVGGEYVIVRHNNIYSGNLRETRVYFMVDHVKHDCWRHVGIADGTLFEAIAVAEMDNAAQTNAAEQEGAVP